MTSPRRNPRLSDPVHAADHLAFMLAPRVWEPRPTVLIVLADDSSRPLVHIEVDECATHPDPTDCVAVLELPIDTACERAGDLVGGVTLGLTRPGPLQIGPFDRVWFRALHRVCHLRGLACWGVYVVGRNGTRPVLYDDVA